MRNSVAIGVTDARSSYTCDSGTPIPLNHSTISAGGSPPGRRSATVPCTRSMVRCVVGDEPSSELADRTTLHHRSAGPVGGTIQAEMPSAVAIASHTCSGVAATSKVRSIRCSTRLVWSVCSGFVHDGSSGRGYDEMVRRCGRRRRGGTGPPARRPLIQVGRRSGTIFRRSEPDHRVDGQGRQTRSLRRAAAIARPRTRSARSPRSDTQPRDDRRPRSDRWQRSATRREQQRGGARNAHESFGDTAPRAFLGQLDQAVGLQRLQVVVHLLTGRPDRRRNRGQPTRVQSARRGSKPGSDRAPSPRRQRLRALEHRPRSPRYP